MRDRMWKKKEFEYDGTKYYDYKRADGTLIGTLVRVPYRKDRDKYLYWNRNGTTVSVQYFDSLVKAKKYMETLFR